MMINKIGTIELSGMRFFAHHGCFEEERITGTNFIVDFKGSVDMSLPSESDDLNDAVNYQSIYNIIKQEMAISSHLMEHVVSRMLKRIHNTFPQIINAKISLKKLSPPLGGDVESSGVVMEY